MKNSIHLKLVYLTFLFEFFYIKVTKKASDFKKLKEYC